MSSSCIPIAPNDWYYTMPLLKQSSFAWRPKKQKLTSLLSRSAAFHPPPLIESATLFASEIDGFLLLDLLGNDDSLLAYLIIIFRCDAEFNNLLRLMHTIVLCPTFTFLLIYPWCFFPSTVRENIFCNGLISILVSTISL